MVDQWPQQTGLIVPGFEIGFCYCTAGVTEGYAVKVGTHATGYLPITVSAAAGDGIGVALKTGSASDTVPVCFYGLMRLDTGGNVTIGQFVFNVSGGATVKAVSGNTAANLSATMKLFGGSSYVLGLALQTATSGDEILVLVGKCI